MENGSPKYWMSLEQWRNDPQFKELVEREFKTSPFAPEDANSGWARREFLKLMGASLALTSFGCVREAQKIVPYAKRPEDIVPGIANYYASTVFDGNEVFGTVVKTREGRPIQIEGNDLHPSNLGATSARAHAVLLNLYDPDRLTEAKQNLLNEKKTNRDTIGISWEKLDENVVGALKKGSAAVLTSTINSPSTKSLLNQFVKNFGLEKYTWEVLNHGDNRVAQKKCFGSEVLPRPRFDKAKYIVSIAADFLGTYLSPTEFTKQYSKSRNPDDKMSKLVVFEPTLSLTGSNADQRYRVKASQLADVVMGLAYQIVIAKKHSNFANSSVAREALEPFAEVYKDLGIEKEGFVKIAEELLENKGQSLVVTGGLVTQTANSLELNIAVNFLNHILENDGKTIDYKNADYISYQGSDSDLTQLVANINSGKVKTLIINGVNPLYSAPAALKINEAFAKLETIVYVGTHLDETALVANFVATDHHPLENWGDAEVQSGVLSLQQPAIQPLYNTRSFQDSLLAWAKLANKDSGMNASSWYDYLEGRWKSVHSSNRTKGIAKSNFDEFWFRLKQEGVFDISNGRGSTNSVRNFNLSALADINKSNAKGMEFVTYETRGLMDGSLANVSWLQEFSDPVTRISWDNYLCVSPKTAATEHLKEGQVVRFKVNGIERSVPIHIQPGQHDDVLALAVGYGRTAAGKVGNGIGVAAFDLASVKGDKIIHSGLNIELTKTKDFIPLANVQGHHSMEGRQIVVESTLNQYKHAPDKVVHKHKVFSLWDKHEYKTYKWAMSVDLNSCTGCGTCTIAC
ncbi:MAG: TAT-variant-translocated molybdopterin oxidoreductase, partial [Bdellovibrionales bacterium]|nr:TAT-variant-translocated molybdopterin oxidoreductase [Bdellovibrionales bacterium]